VRLDRAGWLRDRKRMFGRKVSVEVAELTVSAAPGIANVRFVQTWASERYRDVGPKLMVLLAAPSGLSIAREELLRSDLDAHKKDAPRDAHLFVVDEEAVVLDDNYTDDDKAWSSAQPKELTTSYGWAAAHALDAKKLPPNVAAYIGHRVRLYYDTDEVCTATIRTLRATSRWDPHFATRREWDELSERKRAKAIYADRGTKLLEGVLDKGCTANWARSEALPKPTIGERTTPPEGDTRLQQSRAATAAFRKLPAYAELQNEFVAWGKDTDGRTPRGRWDTYGGPEKDDAPVEPKVFATVVGKEVWIAVSARTGLGCRDWEGSLTAIWSVKGGLVLRATLSEPIAELHAVDLDGDGRIEWLVDGGGYVRLGDDGEPELVRFQIPSYDCPC
jgi:hypothetical protein